jgi:cytochrome P450
MRIEPSGEPASPTSLRDVPHGEPWEFYEATRSAGDIVWDEGANAWLVLSYDLNKQVGLATGEDWESFLVYNHESPQFGLTEDEWNAFNNHGSGRTLMGGSGPSHDHKHRWFMRAFSPKVLAIWGETLIEPIANDAIDEFRSDGCAELYSSYCRRVTPRATAAVLGLPWEDDGLFERLGELREQSLELLSHAQRPWLSPSSDVIDAALAASREIVDLVHPSIVAKRGSDASDFSSMVWRGAEDYFSGEPYTDRDVTAAVLNAWFGATATTTGGAANSLYLVMSQPGLQQRVADGGLEAAKGAVEETLRLYSPSPLIRRIARRDTVLGGVSIRKGDAILALTSAASRDPSHYANPGEVDLNRPSPRDHHGFFMGRRSCAGQGLARYFMERILAVAVQRLPSLKIDPAAEPPRFTGTQQRHWRPLHVLFGTQ